MSKATELRQERHAISLEMQRALDAHNMPKWQELAAKCDAFKAEIDALERQDALGMELSAIRNTERPNISAEIPQRSLSHSESVRSTPEYFNEFRDWLRTGMIGDRMSALSHEQRAVGVGGDGEPWFRPVLKPSWKPS